MREKVKNIAVLGALIAAFESIAYVIGMSTRESTLTWYQTLEKSSLTPPDAVFGIVWSVLYLLMAVSVWFVWRQREEIAVFPALLLFGIHLALNWGWSFIFFELNLLPLAFFWTLALIALAVVLQIMFWSIDRKASWILIPYVAWLCFAAYLSFFIWRHN